MNKVESSNGMIDLSEEENDSPFAVLLAPFLEREILN